MAFIKVDDTTLTRDLWPENKGRMVGDNYSIDQLPRSRLLPLDYDALARWMCVDPCGIDAPATAWIQPEVDGDDERMEVTVRLQGFIQFVALSMIGNWNDTAQGAPKAMQTLTLASGGCVDAFAPQLEALGNVNDLVQKALCRDLINRNIENGQIILKRRVFEKVKPTEVGSRGYTVPFAEDPMGRARKIAHMWAIRHRIDAGSQDGTGIVRRENPLSFKVGDFVDVAVTIQTVSLRLPRGRHGVEVMFVPQAIVKLVSSAQAMAMLKTVAEEYEFLQATSGSSVARRDTGFNFEPREEMEDE